MLTTKIMVEAKQVAANPCLSISNLCMLHNLRVEWSGKSGYSLKIPASGRGLSFDLGAKMKLKNLRSFAGI